MLSSKSSVIYIGLEHLKVKWQTIKSIVSIAMGGVGQYMIGTLSWLFMVRISAVFGSEVLAGYAIAFRSNMFSILPAWCMSNAAATLVVQN